MNDTATARRKVRAKAAAFVLGKLSEREVDVFMRVVQGENLTEIASALGVTHSTVSTYRKRVLGKLGQKTDADLVVLAVYLGFVAYERK